jgi:hypothetical protein
MSDLAELAKTIDAQDKNIAKLKQMISSTSANQEQIRRSLQNIGNPIRRPSTSLRAPQPFLRFPRSLKASESNRPPLKRNSKRTSKFSE